MERYWDCSLCQIENKGEAHRCRNCHGKLKGRERLVWEVAGRRRIAKRAAWLSAIAAGAGQIYEHRWTTGVALGVLVPLAVVLVAATWNGFTYGHIFIGAAAGFVLVVAVLDAVLGPRVKSAPCQEACPAGLKIPDYLQLALDADYEQGHALVCTKVPLPGVIGRICPHPCEDVCTRGIDGEPISINGCKRFLADRRPEGLRSARGGEGARDGGPPVAVVGSGPAGLACAYYLSVLGADVEVYEASERVGGRLATTLPDFRLPGSVLQEEVQGLRDRGIRFATSTPVGPGGVGLRDLLDGHRAVFLGIGAWSPVTLEIRGMERLQDFQEFLRSAKEGRTLPVGRRVAVVGGGNAAMDVCRTALRLGADEVHLLYRRSRAEMPAWEEEVEEAMREGVRFHFLSDPVEARLEDGRLEGLVVREMRLEGADGSGRPKPVAVPDSEWFLEVDECIPALGQRVAGGVLGDPHLAGLRREADGRVWVAPGTQRTSVERVYAGGDAVTGPATAVEAMAQGRRAALEIFGDLCGEELPFTRLADRRIPIPFRGHRETADTRIREEMPRLSLRDREGSFQEVEAGFRESAASREAGRCLQCHRELG